MADQWTTTDRIIEALIKHTANGAYIFKRDEIAEAFNEFLWNGVWDITVDSSEVTQAIRFIQEDEYDQHFDESETDDLDENMVGLIEGHYVFLV